MPLVNPVMAKSTAFPATPSAYSECFRTDLGEKFYYDTSISRWLGELRRDPMIPDRAMASGSTASSAFRLGNPGANRFEILLERVDLDFALTTTDTSTNHFRFELTKVDAAAAAVTIGTTLASSGATQNAWTRTSITPTTLVGSTMEQFNLAGTMVGAASIFATAAIEWRRAST